MIACGAKQLAVEVDFGSASGASNVTDDAYHIGGKTVLKVVLQHCLTDTVHSTETGGVEDFLILVSHFALV
jgi:hypothetical protein